MVCVQSLVNILKLMYSAVPQLATGGFEIESLSFESCVKKAPKITVCVLMMNDKQHMVSVIESWILDTVVRCLLSLTSPFFLLCV